LCIGLFFELEAAEECVDTFSSIAIMRSDVIPLSFTVENVAYMCVFHSEYSEDGVITEEELTNFTRKVSLVVYNKARRK